MKLFIIKIMKRKSKIDRIFSEISKERGRRAEKIAEDVLNQMMENGEIVSFYKTNKRLDKFQGIDFVIITINGEKIPIQIKSSEKGAETHLKNFPQVPVIVIQPYESYESIKNKIRNLINVE